MKNELILIKILNYYINKGLDEEKGEIRAKLQCVTIEDFDSARLIAY